MSATSWLQTCAAAAIIGWALVLLFGCGSSAALATPVQTIPQHVTLTLDASDGGTITVGGLCQPSGQPPGSETRVERAATERLPAAATAAPTPTVRGDCGGGSVWLDARGGGAGAETQQSGTEIDTAIDAAASIAASGSGSASSGPASGSAPASTTGGR